MVTCNQEEIKVVTINQIFQEYPSLLQDLLETLKYNQCQANNQILTLLQNPDKEETIYTSNGKFVNGSSKCLCSELYFQMNVLFYIYIFNTCLLVTGDINTNEITETDQTIVISIKNKGSITNTNINNSQTQSQQISMVNLSDQSTMTYMSQYIYKIISSLSQAFQENKIDTYVTIVSNTLQENVQQAVKSSVEALTDNSQLINLQLTNDEYQKLTVTNDQKLTLTLIMQQLSNNILHSLFSGGALISTENVNCKSTTPNEPIKSPKSSQKEIHNNAVGYIFPTLFVLFLFFIVVYFFEQKKKSKTQRIAYITHD